MRQTLKFELFMSNYFDLREILKFKTLITNKKKKVA